MEVISTNLGEKQAIKWQGKEVFTGIYKYPVNEPLALGLNDVEKDQVIDRKYHGGIDKACYLYSADHYDFWKSKYPDLNWQWGMFGENLTIKGLNELKIKIGDVYKLGTALVIITQPRQPCFKLGIRLKDAKAVKLFVNEKKPGAYIRILQSGTVNKNDTMILVESKPENYSLTEIFSLIYSAKENHDQVKRAIKMPELAESCRDDLIKYSGISI
ncbi:MAG: MOSC domain-containing protein [Salinivirgaceae bacterium]|jgi:MOSC domain-containing protein YiiM|nr:MOSC domain-containing protein [Salinivirgaceae bacterium]